MARRFSIIGEQYDFEMFLDGEPVTIDDREYEDKLQYLWTFGEIGERCRETAKKLDSAEPRHSAIDEHSEYKVDGWIGSAFTSGQLKEPDTSESINKIIIMVRGKLAQEDILEEFNEGGLYTKYLFGEIHANFLDLDEEEDIATTSRQRLIEEDPRYQVLKQKVQSELKYIQSKWTELRNQQGTQEALAFPQIEEWFDDLDADKKKAAEKLFGRINQLPMDNPDQKRQILVSSVLAFESLKLRNMLHRLDEVSTENLEALNQVFVQLDDLEASAYYQIAKDRLEVILKLRALVDGDAKERALAEHLHQHLWLLDPSWERATTTAVMEKGIRTALKSVNDSLTDEQKRARVDSYYSTTANKHVIIELKRASRLIKTSDLHDQIFKYCGAAEKILSDAGRRNEPLEIVCVVGRRLKEWDESPPGEERSRNSLSALNARVVMYDELIDNALQAYQDYVDRRDETGRVYRLIQEISEQDVQAIHAAEP